MPNDGTILTHHKPSESYLHFRIMNTYLLEPRFLKSVVFFFLTFVW